MMVHCTLFLLLSRNEFHLFTLILSHIWRHYVSMSVVVLFWTCLQDMKRALFVYAKLNPGIKYVQGMNEIYAPIYHQFATDTDSVAAQHAEADAFFCFVELISEFRDHFCQHLVSKAWLYILLYQRMQQGSKCHPSNMLIACLSNKD